MKRLLEAVLLTVLTGCLVLPSVQTPIHAAIRAAFPSALEGPPAGVSTQDNRGAKIYAASCAVCHGDQRQGNLPAFPPLLGIEHRMTNRQIAEMIHKGKAPMPAVPDLQGKDLAALLRFLTSAPPSASAPVSELTGTAHLSALSQAGNLLFQQNCAFCHGRDAMGGESGPDLTQSKLVLADVKGDKITQVVREGRPDKKMPPFSFSDEEMSSLAAFIHSQVTAAASKKGGRRGVTVADLQTGNVEAGKQYFEGAGGCAQCHSTTGDLAGVATRYQGLELEERMLFPKDATSKVTVTLPSGQTVAGTLAYLDEFTVALRDSSGAYRAWRVEDVKYSVDAPVEAHVSQFSKYSDGDIHNLMAYLQTLR
jgi:mono/diheme cytochrome c family protein